MSNEPVIAPGDWNEHVELLQERLRHLGYYEGSADGRYGPGTEAAVRLLQEAAGIEPTSFVEESTWEALERQESLYGSAQQAPATGEAAATDDRQLSEDGMWWWDGAEWRATEEQTATGDAGSSQAEFQLSPDGQYQWDGTQWLPVGGATAMVGFAVDGQADEAGGLPQPQPGPFGTADQSDRPGLTSASTAEALRGFETGLADLLPEHMEILAGIAAELNAHPLNGGFVTLTGTADRRGDPAANKALGQQRADVVRDYLVRLIEDPETQQAIRAYSLGALDDGAPGDQPELRRVDIAVTRRTLQLPAPHPTEALPQGQPYKLPERTPIPGPWPTPPFPWVGVPQAPPNKDFWAQLNEWLDHQVFDTDDLERLGGDIASIFGQDRTVVRGKLDEALRSGKEAAVKAVVKAFVDWLAGALRTPPPGPAQGPPDPIPFPPTQGGATFRF